MDSVTSLSISTNWKGDSYSSILVIINRLTKMVYYKLIKVTINILGLAKIIINVVVRHSGLLDWIVTDWGSFFTSKFWSSLCYFLGIRQRLFTTFYLQIDNQTEKQNSILEVYFQAFVNFKQNDWIWLFPMAKLTYNNAKNASTGHTLFEPNCRYHSCVFYKKDFDLHLKLKITEELSFKHQNLMAVCSKLFIMPKNFRSKPIIRKSSLEAMH